MKWVIRISSPVHLLILAVLFILCFSFSGLLARSPRATRVYAPSNPAFADPGEDPHLRMDIVIQADGNLQGSSGNDSYDSTGIIPVSVKGEKRNSISRGDTLTYKFRFVLYSIFGIYLH